MELSLDDLSGPEIAEFLEEHIKEMRSVSPPESTHALELAGLRQSGITFWVLRHVGKIAGCGAIRQIDGSHGEIKSMRTSREFRRRGIASLLLEHMIEESRARGYERLSLETGAMAFFEPARNLYRKFGFEPCAAFSTYKPDPNSVFLTKVLVPARPTGEPGEATEGPIIRA